MTNLGNFRSPDDDFSDSYIDSGQYPDVFHGFDSFSDVFFDNDLIDFSIQNMSNKDKISPNSSKKPRKKAWFAGFEGVSALDQSFGDPTRAPKRKIDLSRTEMSFKDRFYAIFTTKKKFEKNLVRIIHNHIRKQLGLRTMSREEYRRIDLYFQHFAKYSETIIPYLSNHREEIYRKFFPIRLNF